MRPGLRYYNYYGVVGNAQGLNEFYREAIGILFKWLNRRSQRRSFNGQGFNDLLEHFAVPQPRVLPKRRIEKPAAIQLALSLMRCSSTTPSASWRSANQGLKLDAEASISEEPGAGKPHAGICAGQFG